MEFYEFRIKGHLDDRWQERFGGFALERLSDGSTILRGLIHDQAALHGIFNRLRDLGLPLLSVHRVPEYDNLEALSDLNK